MSRGWRESYTSTTITGSGLENPRAAMKYAQSNRRSKLVDLIILKMEAQRQHQQT